MPVVNISVNYSSNSDEQVHKTIMKTLAFFSKENL